MYVMASEKSSLVNESSLPVDNLLKTIVDVEQREATECAQALDIVTFFFLVIISMS